MTTTTLFLGWWGTISMVVTPFFLLNNMGRYLLYLGTPGVPSGARAPQLTDKVIDQLNPHATTRFGRLNDGEDFKNVASAIADRAGVTPGQVALYVRAVVQARAQS